MPRPLLYFIRHGETNWNAEGRVQGARDIPLNQKGIGQASAAGAILLGVLRKTERLPAHFDYVSSPLGRARHTMDLLRAALGLPSEGYRLDHDLREIAYGDWEGMTFAEMEQHSPAHYALRLTDRWSTAAPAGESYAQVGERLAAWYGALQVDTVAVAHGGTMRALMTFLGHLDPQQASDTPIVQGAVYVFDNNRLEKFT
jgi:probable phosphoglycerate mutase